MSKVYSLSADLLLEYNTETVFELLEHGQIMGFKYQTDDLRTIKINVGNFLTTEQATHNIIHGIPDKTMNSISVTYDHTIFSLSFSKNSDKYISLMLMDTFLPFQRKYLDGEIALDLSRYARLFITFLATFPVYDFEIRESL